MMHGESAYGNWGIAVTMDLLAIAHQQGGVAPALRAIF